LALATYQNRVQHDPVGPEDRKNRYFKEPVSGKKRYLQGARRYVLGLDTAATAIKSVIELRTLTDRELNVFGDEELSKLKEGPILSLGSSTSNALTENILALLPRDKEIEFTTDSLKCWLPGSPLKSSTDVDFAVLIRVQRESRIHFACAGIDEEGTVAVTRYLIENWQSLPRTNFVRIFKCGKMNTTFEQLAEANF